MIEEELEKLLQHNWPESDKQLIQRLIDGLLYYKRILPKSLKKDILGGLQLCNKLKTQLVQTAPSDTQTVIELTQTAPNEINPNDTQTAIEDKS
jgi:hypothetical protein